jgi:hypothetical protein
VRFSEGRERWKMMNDLPVQLTVKTDENVEKVRSHGNILSSFRHQNDSGGIEYGQRNSERHFNNKFEHEKSKSQRICQFLTRKQIPVLKRTLQSPDLAPCNFFFPKIEKLETHFQSAEDIHKKMAELLKVLHRMT